MGGEVRGAGGTWPSGWCGATGLGKLVECPSIHPALAFGDRDRSSLPTTPADG
jgi:hypothetical protein